MYRVAKASQYLVITGFRIEDIKIATKAWVLPGQSYSAFDISPVNYTFEVMAMSAKKLPFILPAVFTIGPRSDDQESLHKYAKLISSHDKHSNNMNELVKGIIEGETRVLAAVTSRLFSEYNYGLFGRSIGRDLINNPDLLATDPTLSFQSAIWFWMTPRDNKPSSNDVITRRWRPSAADGAAGHVSGFGVITNIINGGLECGKGRNNAGEDRIGFYRRYCSMLGVSPGDNLDCYNQRSFA